MNFAILRAKRVKNINTSFSHNLRASLEHCRHVNHSKSETNEFFLDKLNFQNATGNFENLIDDYIKQEKIFVKKGTTTKVMEFLLTASPEFFENASKKELDEWKKEQLNFAKKEWGNSVLLACAHFDEKSPHLQIMVLADKKKVHKYKNQKGDFFKEKHSISPGDFNPEYLRGLQDRYAESNKKFGLIRGLRNSKATHRTLKEFYNAVGSAMSKNYDKVARRAITNILKEKQNILGYIKAKDIPGILEPILNKLLTDNKKVKTLINFNTQENIKELEKVLADKKNVESLRTEYFESIKNYSTLKAENVELTKKLNEYKQKEEKQAQKKPSVNIDTKLKIR